MNDWTTVGQGLAAGVALTLIAWFGRHLTNARNRAETEKADAEGTLYRLLVDRLEQVEARVTILTAERDTERAKVRDLEQHIFHLENTMRRAGLDPPARVHVMGQH